VGEINFDELVKEVAGGFVCLMCGTRHPAKEDAVTCAKECYGSRTAEGTGWDVSAEWEELRQRRFKPDGRLPYTPVRGMLWL
jgi:hypothetical protein